MKNAFRQLLFAFLETKRHPPKKTILAAPTIGALEIYLAFIDRWNFLRFDSAMNITNGSGAMFDGIAKRYDLLNALTSMGFDKSWRKQAISELNLKPGQTLLDLAAGTLDISISALDMYPSITVIAADPSREMLKVGRRKRDSSSPSNHAHPTTPIQLIAANGEHLPLGANSIHGAIIAFGIRNFSDRHRSLRQLSKSLVPSGRLIILELSIPTGGIMAAATRFYIKTVIPLLGTLLSSGAEYAYLPKSMEKFPGPKAFASELRSAGFEVIRIQPFMSGACHLYVCERQEEKTDI